jgi:hypothetical protein
MTAEDTANAKPTVAHSYLSDEGFVCPIGQRFTHCISCDFTDIVGQCAWPVDINKEIAEGRARPCAHEYDWPERAADFAMRSQVARERPCKLL